MGKMEAKISKAARKAARESQNELFCQVMEYRLRIRLKIAWLIIKGVKRPGLFKRWLVKPAKWWQFWLPQSGIVGGFILCLIILNIIQLIFIFM